MQAGSGVGRNHAPPMLLDLGLHTGKTAEPRRKEGGVVGSRKEWGTLIRDILNFIKDSFNPKSMVGNFFFFLSGRKTS